MSGPYKRVHCWKKEITIPYVVREIRNMIEDVRRVRRGLKVKPLIRRFIINQTDSPFALFVTSKIEFSNAPTLEFKVLQNAFKIKM